ncbi:MAG: hypothetical protein CV087_13020 [Candidatus Brocadia sp. WS118]|nr:MAG: hypothetical protein CV087_13020 [Candidatus Brocadia sp. WS118]
MWTDLIPMHVRAVAQAIRAFAVVNAAPKEIDVVVMSVARRAGSVTTGPVLNPCLSRADLRRSR